MTVRDLRKAKVRYRPLLRHPIKRIVAPVSLYALLSLGSAAAMIALFAYGLPLLDKIAVALR
jgi:hypothetical protein